MHGFKMVGRGLIALSLGFLALLAAPSPASAAKQDAPITVTSP